MRVLVACEESQAVCKAFRERGHEAYSCDLQECSGGHPEWHIRGDALAALNPKDINATLPLDDIPQIVYGIEFTTMDGKHHYFNGKWDLIIAHPPCTYLSNAGACRLFPKKGQLNQERYQKGLDAKAFFMEFYNADCDKICIENPIPTRVYGLPPYSQIVQPYEYGHHYSKKTCLWLKGLPNLQPTDIVTENIISWVSGGSKDNKGNPRKNKGTVYRDAKTRSKTFTGIANAMADQWGNLKEEIQRGFIEEVEQISIFDVV